MKRYKESDELVSEIVVDCSSDEIPTTGAATLFGMPVEVEAFGGGRGAGAGLRCRSAIPAVWAGNRETAGQPVRACGRGGWA